MVSMFELEMDNQLQLLMESIWSRINELTESGEINSAYELHKVITKLAEIRGLI